MATLARKEETELVESEVAGVISGAAELIESEVSGAVSEAVAIDGDTDKQLEVVEEPLIVVGRNSTFELHSSEDGTDSGDDIQAFESVPSSKNSSLPLAP